MRATWVWLPTIHTRTDSPARIRHASEYKTCGTSAIPTATRSSASIALPAAAICGVILRSTSRPASGSPPSAPTAAAIGKPTIPVPGTVTPMPFFIRLGETFASILSGIPPRWWAATAQASAKDIGSVQPSAGFSSWRIALANSPQRTDCDIRILNSQNLPFNLIHIEIYCQLKTFKEIFYIFTS